MIRSFNLNFINNTIKDISIITIIYTITFSIILLNHGIFWDDWLLYNQESSLCLEQFAQAGGFINTGYLHTFIFSFNSAVLIYRVITFLLYLSVTLLLFRILSSIKQIDRSSRFFIVLIFCIFPVNFARIAAIDVPYIIYLNIFMLGFIFIDLYIKKPNLLLRIISLFLFLISFQVGSLLFFYASVIIYLFVMRFDIKQLSVKKVLRWGLKYPDYLLLPFIYWIAMNIFAIPTGLYEGYNAVSLEGLSYTGPILSILSIITSFLLPILNALNPGIQVFNVGTYLLMVLLMTMFFSVVIRRMFSKEQSNNCFNEDKPREIHMFIVGFLLFLLAVYPYSVVGRLPHLYGWESRHQLLVPFGASFIIYYGLKIICREFRNSDRAFWLFSSLIIIIFILCNINVYLEYQKDWYKQLSLMEAFEQDNYMQEPGTFYFIDISSIKNARDRNYNFYEYTGMFKEIYGDETRLGLNYEQKGDFDSLVKYFQPYYNLSDYVMDSPEYNVIISKGSTNINNLKVLLSLIYNQLMNHGKFMSYLNNIVEIEVNPVIH